MPASSTYKSYMLQVMPLLLCCLDITSKPFSLALLLIITIKASLSIYWFRLTSLPHRSGLNNILDSLRDLVLYLEHLLKSLCHLHFFEWGRVLASNSNYPLGHRKSKIIPEKTLTSASLTMLKPLTVWIIINCGKLFKRWENQTTLPAFCETCMQIKKQQLELHME